MNIRCPKCQTAYVIPDESVGNKPKKMRCARCREVFTVKRRSQETPIGYQEFTGQQNALPREFAFLRPSLPPPENDAPSSRPKTGGSPPPVPVGKKPPAAPSSSYEDFTETPDLDEMRTNPGLAPPVKRQSAPAPAPAPVPVPVPVPEINTQPAAVSSDRPASGPKAALSVSDLYGGNSWGTEAPLDLGNYAVSSEKSRLIGKIMALVCGVIFLFFLFVMFRNGWNLSLSDLPEHIAFAFSGGEYEDLPDTVNDLEVTVNEKRLLSRSGSDSLLIVTGAVFNNSPIRRTSVILRGRLIDTEGDVKGEVHNPCDKIFEDSALKKIRPGQLPELYRHRGTPYDCTISGEASSLFQMVFDNVPADYDQSYTVDVKPIFAE